MTTYHIHVTGIVQGVGFRPYVYQFCVSRNLVGTVNNTNDGVHIVVNSNPESILAIKKELIEKAPALSYIQNVKIEKVELQEFSKFKIVSSQSNSTANLLLTPDYATCNVCNNELKDTNDKRFKYPFITCTHCGPRYSITKNLPYDREQTTMQPFEMCDDCLEEYQDPTNRRYFSQTNSCKKCAIELTLIENGKSTHNFTDLDFIVEQWKEGKIIAIKGIGGFLLTCDATNESVIKRLRKLKNRPAKPFALIYHDIYELSEDVEMGIGEKLELESPAAPIVLLSIKQDRMTPIVVNEIAPNLSLLGAMLPNTPLFHLLLERFKTPIIATSGNVSNSTIVYQDERIDELLNISDLVLTNNREIVVPQDDSVIRYTSIKSYRTVIRRSRGLAPSFLNNEVKLPSTTVMAMGGMLKSSFALLHNNNVHISQYLGNTINMEAQENFSHTITHFKKLFRPNIEVILTDKHPDYYTTSFGKSEAEKLGVRFRQVQHHKAHFFAVLGENNLFTSTEKVLGVIWDGTGLGDDGNIWGGEFFEYQNGITKRVGHLNEFPFILGDKMAKEPRISAFVMAGMIDNNQRIRAKFTDTEWGIYQKLASSSTIKSSSMGRFFDAAASLILGVDKQSFEGEAAMQLESAAYRYFRANNFTLYYSYLKDGILPENIVSFILQQIVSDLDKDFQPDFIAAKFHISMAHYISLTARQLKVKKIAFSGGVFQNQWLIELILSCMNKDFDLYFHKELSPNDECLSFGQLMYHLHSNENDNE